LFFIGLAVLAIALDEVSGGAYMGYRFLPISIAIEIMIGVVGAYFGLEGYKSGTAFSRAFVVIGPDGLRLQLVTKGFPFKLLPEQRFKWEEIGHIACGRGICGFRAGSQVYELNGFNSPSPTTVAQLMAERKDVQLSAQELLIPLGPKLPSLTKSAKMGGIGLALIGAVAAGGFWLYRHQNGPHYVAEFITLFVLGFLGLFFVGMAIIFS
jgi:hypothetical protein